MRLTSLFFLSSIILHKNCLTVKLFFIIIDKKDLLIEEAGHEHVSAGMFFAGSVDAEFCAGGGGAERHAAGGHASDTDAGKRTESQTAVQVYEERIFNAGRGDAFAGSEGSDHTADGDRQQIFGRERQAVRAVSHRLHGGYAFRAVAGRTVPPVLGGAECASDPAVCGGAAGSQVH